MIKTVSLFFASIFFIFGCGSKNNELIETTFKRSFDKDIISSQLASNNTKLINSALLSISHSEDTSFIPMITSLPYSDFPEMICFAVGQIGPCHSSTHFLWNKLNTNEFKNNSRFIFEAIGKTGDKNDLVEICNMYSNSEEKILPYSGISLAIRQFAFRGITSEEAVQVLADEVINLLNSVQNKNDALFTLARTGSSDKINDAIIQLLKTSRTESPDTIKLKQYSLMNLRAQQFFPNDEIVLKSVLAETNVLLRIEAASSVCYRKMNTEADVDLYLKFLTDENPNVSRAAANSISSIQVSSNTLNEYLKNKIESFFVKNLTPHTLGELLVSYTELYSPPVSFLEPYFFSDIHVPSRYWYNFLGRFKDDTDAFSSLIKEFNATTILKNRILILNNLIGFQTNFISDKNLNELLIESLSSNQAPLVAITADAIDSLIIEKNKDLLKNKIRDKLNEQKDNPDFAEGIMYLVNLAEKIDSSFYSEMTQLAISSNVYSVKKFISDKENFNTVIEKPVDHLEEIIDYSFKYSKAKIETGKGYFIIEFLPEYAPVSVGNFCYLAGKKFYNNVEFHRVVPGFVIQCGDTSGTGWGGPGYEIISETSPLNYEVGLVGMASAGKDTEGSQWFVMQGNYPHLNGRYTIFGRIIYGMNVVYNIAQNDKIIKIELQH